jgi:hypothetical protein
LFSPVTGEYRETVSQLAEKLVAEALLLAEDVKVVVDNCMDRWAAAQSGASSQPVYSDLHCSSSMSTTHTVWALLSHALRAGEWYPPQLEPGNSFSSAYSSASAAKL